MSERGLSSQTETANQGSVTLNVPTFEVIEQLAPAIDHTQQTLSGMMIMDVGFEMVGKVGDPGGQQGHLHLRRSRVARRGGVITDHLGLIGCY